MDLLKTLLLYMIMTTSAATLESGATPIPYEQLYTPAPTSYVVVTQTPKPGTPAPTATPKPSPTLPPVSLYEGLKGSYVRMLQQELYDMGYLASQPDGAFGKLTKQAVEAFQKRNGLEADGIAGPQTIAKLYAADRVPHQSKVTPVPTKAPTKAPTATPTVAPTKAPTTVPTQVPTAAPTQTPTAVPAPAAADVKVLYVCGQETLKTVTLTLEEGKTPVYPASARVPAG